MTCTTKQNTVACACRWVVAAIDAVTVEQAFDFSSYNKTKPEGTEWQVRCLCELTTLCLSDNIHEWQASLHRLASSGCLHSSADAVQQCMLHRSACGPLLPLQNTLCCRSTT